jgi:hypothetical protein
LNFHVYEGSGKLKVTSQAIKNWLQPKTKKLPFMPMNSYSQPSSLANQIQEQQRMMRYMDPSRWPNLSSQQYHNNNINDAHHLPRHLPHLPANKKGVKMQQIVPNGVAHAMKPMNKNEIVLITSAKEEVVST